MSVPTSRKPARPASGILDVLPVAEAPVDSALAPPPAAPAPAADKTATGQAPASWLRVRLFGFSVDWIDVFGAVCVIVGLAVLAAIPVFQFLSLGYLLEAGGRVARTGRLRDGFIGVRQAARVGSIVLGVWLMLLPLRLVSSMALSAELIEPGGVVAHRWRLALIILTVVMTVHILIALARGGKLRHFLWPFTNPFWLARRLWQGSWYTEARDGTWAFVTSLRLPYYFWLGLRGFAGAFLWLVVPISLLALGGQLGKTNPGAGFLVGWAGAFLLMWVLMYVPFLQMRFAAENRFRALFELGEVRAAFRRAPWAFAFSFVLTLALALPLYLLKIEMVPREVAWLPSLFFVVFIFPARLLTGWAYGRAERRATPRHWFFRWTGWLWMPPAVAFYVLVVFFTQYTAWDGVWSLYEQHAFLLPVPFLGM
jgi:hypothetical protein